MHKNKRTTDAARTTLRAGRRPYFITRKSWDEWMMDGVEEPTREERKELGAENSFLSFFSSFFICIILRAERVERAADRLKLCRTV